MVSFSPEYIEASTPYLEKGLIYMGIVVILLAIWILLRYKIVDR